MYSLMDLELARQINQERYDAALARRAARAARLGRRRGPRPRLRLGWRLPVAPAAPVGCRTPMGCSA